MIISSIVYLIEHGIYNFFKLYHPEISKSQLILRYEKIFLLNRQIMSGPVEHMSIKIENTTKACINIETRSNQIFWCAGGHVHGQCGVT